MASWPELTRLGSRGRVIGVLAVVALALAGCGSGSSGGSGSGSSSGGSSGGAATTGTSTSGGSPTATNGSENTATSGGSSSSVSYADAVTNYPEYVGGSGAANPKLAPVTIGFVNMQGGSPSQSFPQATAAAQAAVKMINGELGGVHGHPVKLDPCFIASTAGQGLACGQQMAAGKSVEAIAFGLVSVGNSSIYNVLKGSIPVIIGVSPNPADDTARNVFELEGSSTSATGAYGTFIKRAYPSAKTIAIAYQNIPGTTEIAEGEKAAFAKVGLSVKLLPYSPTTTDLTGPATQMEQADIGSPACGFVDCPLIAKSMSEIGDTKPAISTPLWTYLPPQAYPGGDLPHWIVGEAASNLNYPADPAVAAFRKQSEKYGLPAADTLNVFASFAWTDIVVAAKMMNAIPYAKLSPDAVAAKLKAFTGSVPLGPPSVNCSGSVDPSAPAVCNDASQFFQYEGHGRWKQVAGWLKPPS